MCALVFQMPYEQVFGPQTPQKGFGVPNTDRQNVFRGFWKTRATGGVFFLNIFPPQELFFNINLFGRFWQLHPCSQQIKQSQTPFLDLKLDPAMSEFETVSMYRNFT